MYINERTQVHGHMRSTTIGVINSQGHPKLKKDTYRNEKQSSVLENLLLTFNFLNCTFVIKIIHNLSDLGSHDDQ